MFEIVEKESSGTVIKVVGIGGAGGNAVDHMIREGVEGVESSAPTPTRRRSSATRPRSSCNWARADWAPAPSPTPGAPPRKASANRVAEALDGAHMVFITAGMGGGTGTGAAPVVAEIAREKGILTVAVVTKPFQFEGKRMKIAEAGTRRIVAERRRADRDPERAPDGGPGRRRDGGAGVQGRGTTCCTTRWRASPKSSTTPAWSTSTSRTCTP